MTNAVSSLKVGIPIVLMGKDRAMADKMTAFLRPDYEAIFYTDSIDELFSKLPRLIEPRPQAVFIGHSFSQQEQDDLAAKLTEVTVVKSLPYDPSLLEMVKDVEPQQKAPVIIKTLLDRMRAEFAGK